MRWQHVVEAQAACCACSKAVIKHICIWCVCAQADPECENAGWKYGKANGLTLAKDDTSNDGDTWRPNKVFIVTNSGQAGAVPQLLADGPIPAGCGPEGTGTGVPCIQEAVAASSPAPDMSPAVERQWMPWINWKIRWGEKGVAPPSPAHQEWFSMPERQGRYDGRWDSRECDLL